MINPDNDTILAALKKQIFLQSIRIESVWEACEWSQTFKIIDASGTSYFLKATPRERQEALVTEILWRYDSSLIPQVLITDLLPEHEWRWFLMQDAGKTDYDTLSLEAAEKTAFAIGVLQRKGREDQQLPDLLPQALPSQYRQILEKLLSWIEANWGEANADLLARVRSSNLLKTAFFDEVIVKLAPLYPSSVHTDLWSGNIAISEDGIRLIDWGDAVWGIGSVSIVNLIFSSETQFAEDKLWEAYGKGLELELSPELIQTSLIAYLMTGLVTEHQLTLLSTNKRAVPLGIPPLLEELLRLFSASL